VAASVVFWAVPPDQQGRSHRQFMRDPAIGNNVGRA